MALSSISKRAPRGKRFESQAAQNDRSDLAQPNYLWSGPVIGLASIRDSPTTVLRPYVPVRADVNTDAIAPIMYVVGRAYRVGRVRSRPTTRLRPTACSRQTHGGSTTSHLLPSTCGLGWPLGLAANGMERRLSEAVDGTAHAERTAIEHVRVHHRRADIRVPQQLLHVRMS